MTTALRSLVSAFALLVGAQVTARMQVSPRPESSAPPGTALIIGQIVDGSTGQPVPETRVELTPATVGGTPTASSQRVIVDANGRFFFAGLPAGRYGLRAVKAGYLESRGIQRRPEGPPTSIELSDGQHVIDARMPIWRFGSITGTVFDDAGEPRPGLEVRALRKTIVSGRPRFSIVLPNSTTTDDRGRYRLTSLPPGEYVVTVPAMISTFPASVMIEAGRTGGFGQPEFSSAIRELAILGSAANQQFGDSVLMMGNRAPLPPAAVNGRIRAYATGYYPPSVGGPPTTTISIASGDERSADLQLRLVPTARVAGTLTGPNGPLGKTALRLVPAGLGDSMSEADQETVTGVTDERGVFTLLGVPSGQYQLRVLTPRLSGGALTPASTTDKPILWATEPLSVSDADLTGLTIVARPTLTVTGRVDFRGASGSPRPDQIANLASGLDSASGGPGANARTDQSGRFLTSAPAGLYHPRADAPPGWRIVAIEIDGSDAMDGPVKLTSDASLVIVMTDAPTEVSGVVRDDRGEPDNRGLVAIFPANREWWTNYGPAARQVRSTQAEADGRYSIRDLPAGEYFVASIPDSLAQVWQDPRNVDTLARGAARVTIVDGQKRIQDLKRSVIR